MTDPIGTAQERELIERLRRKGVFHEENPPLRLNNPDGPEAADALQSRIAEVGRLTERVRELGGGCEANDGGLHSIMGGDKEPFCPDCGLMLKRIAYVLPHLKPNEVRAALSLQRRV